MGRVPSYYQTTRIAIALGKFPSEVKKLPVRELMQIAFVLDDTEALRILQSSPF